MGRDQSVKRPRRTLLALGLASSIGAGTTPGCGGSGDGWKGSCPLPLGAVLTQVTGVPKQCQGSVFRIVPAASCGFLNCACDAAYVYCDGNSFTACGASAPGPGCWTEAR